MIIPRTNLQGRVERVSGRLSDAFTLAEVVIAIAIVATVFGGIILGYTQAARRAQWSGYSLAAQALAIQQLEQARSAVYDPSVTPVKNEITNLNLNGWTYAGGVWSGYSWTNLDLPTSGSNYVRATNYVTVSMIWITTNPPVTIQMVQVNTVWPFTWGANTRLFTNTLASYYAPDNPESGN